MIAPTLIGLVRSPFGFALWNKEDHRGTPVDEKYIRASDAEFLLSLVDYLVEATGEEIDPDDQATISQIRADLGPQL